MTDRTTAVEGRRYGCCPVERFHDIVMVMSNEKLLAHALDLSRRGHDESAGRILTRLAEAGDAEAAAHLGELFEHGSLECPETAARWYKLAAEGGSPRGAMRHALELDDPQEGDSEAAKPWYEAARKGLEQEAAAGHAASQYLLSKIYTLGWGGPADKERGVTLLEQAAQGGDLEAKFYLGYWYWGLPDRTEAQRATAIRLWREAAEGGLMSAQYNLGVNYATDPDMPIDFKESMRFYRMAADNGMLEALYNIGTMYQDAEGVEKDEALILHAGEQGEYLAQYYLMQAYEEGYHGLPVDKDEAAYWRQKCEANIGDD
ncbi:MAG: sel1 repeat family protein [Rhodospirillales bacterium]|nr:sel1 repeat family protein [Rhodospirillales bacterium]